MRSSLQRLISPYALTRAVNTPWSPQLEGQVQTYSGYHINRLSMSNLLEFGAMVNRREALKQSCAFIHNEGPIRLAHMIQEMRTLPDLFLSQPMINRVYNWYLASFRDMIESPSMFATEDDVAKYSSGFADVLRGILRRHGPTVMTIALGFKNLRDHGQLKGFDIYVQEFLNRFFMSRISVRFLFSQHLALFADETKPAVTDAKSRWIGAIQTNCNVGEIATDAAANAKDLVFLTYQGAPEVHIVQPKVGHYNKPFAYIPSHLYHILFELMKNSIRAVTEFHQGDKLPPIRVVIVKGEDDLTIKLSDEGGGFPHHDTSRMFEYFYTTAPTPVYDETESEALKDMNNAPLAGFGYGLPVSRLYARYFGGDLKLISMQGYGTDAFVFLRTVAENAQEIVPSYSERELRYQQVSHNKMYDWMNPHRHH